MSWMHFCCCWIGDVLICLCSNSNNRTSPRYKKMIFGVDDIFLMLVTEANVKKKYSKWSKPSPTSYSCHQHIASPTSMWLSEIRKIVVIWEFILQCPICISKLSQREGQLCFIWIFWTWNLVVYTGHSSYCLPDRWFFKKKNEFYCKN